MGRKVKDLTGMKFGRLTVIKEHGRNKHGHVMWLCRCECGSEIVVDGGHLKSGRTTSCGCYQKDRTKEMLKEKWQDEEYKQMQSNRMRERWDDEEFRQMQSNRMREVSKKLWEDEEFRLMQSELSSKRLKEIWQDKEYRQMKSDKMREINIEKWKDEEYRHMKHKEMIGGNNPNYKGGITPISIYLRGLPVVSQWRKDTYTRENSGCQITGKKVHGGNSDVHHLYGFNMIVVEAHKSHNIQVKPQVKDYTQEELHKLEEYIASWHKDTNNAVLLSKEVHELFHNCKDKDGNVLYGYGNNTPEQFEEFKQRYIAGEFKGLI